MMSKERKKLGLCAIFIQVHQSSHKKELYIHSHWWTDLQRRDWTCGVESHEVRHLKDRSGNHHRWNHSLGSRDL